MKKYWIAINGASCAHSAIPWNLPCCTPVPELLIGFPTRKEAYKAQQGCLNLPIDDAKRMMLTWLDRKDVQIIKPRNPGKTTRGPTIWQEGKLQDHPPE